MKNHKCVKLTQEHKYHGNMSSRIWWRFQMETFPRYWPSVRGIHQSSVNSPHKDQWRGALIFFFDLRLNKRLCKQWWGWWFETPSRPFWRHCNEDTSHSPWMLQISCWKTVRIQLTNYNTTSTATDISFHSIEIKPRETRFRCDVNRLLK